MEPKTLIDFEDMKYPQRMLKAEAVKWVKRWKENGTPLADVWVKGFFNITEDDLQ